MDNKQMNKENLENPKKEKVKKRKKKKGYIAKGSIGLAFTLAIAATSLTINNDKKLEDKIAIKSSLEVENGGEEQLEAENRELEVKGEEVENRAREVEEYKENQENTEDEVIEIEEVEEEEFKEEEVNEDRSSKLKQDVYGDIDGNEKIGKIGKGEKIFLMKNIGEFSYIEYNSAGGMKRGYVPKDSLKEVEMIKETVNNFNVPSNVEKVVYGTSGMGRNLYYYKIGHGKRTILMNFAIHGYEDAFNKDGYELANMAKGIIKNLAKDYKDLELEDWSIYIIPTSNPDGILDGQSNNGLGRCQISKGIDLNRSFPVDFLVNESKRNNTGEKPLLAPEGRALADLTSKLSKRGKDFIVLDVHGWLNETIGDFSVGKYFDREFGFKNKLPQNAANGYFITYAKSLGAKTSLIELPKPSGKADIKNKDFQGKLYKGLVNLMKNY